MAKIFVVLCLLALYSFVSAETGCPEPEDVLPCVCTNSPTTYLECKNIQDAEDLRKVFRNSERYRYKEVHIEYSSMQFLPYDLFQSVNVSELYLKNVTLAQLFDRVPVALDELRTLFIENTVLLRGVIWQLLEPLKSLRLLYIYYNVIKSLGTEFSQYAPKELEQIVFYATETKTLRSGVFANFTKLDRVSVDAGKLETLTRDIFPVPFNGRVLYFNNNKISSIPNDLFTQMPNLQTLGMRGNQIASVPESAFSGTNFGKIDYVWFDDNPLKCDCTLQWITRNKPADLRGKCESPKRLHGRELKELNPGDFNC